MTCDHVKCISIFYANANCLGGLIVLDMKEGDLKYGTLRVTLKISINISRNCGTIANPQQGSKITPEW